MKKSPITRKKMIQHLNGDLAREYQAIIAYVVYSQTMKGAQYLHIAGELEKHAAQELSHALQIAKQDHRRRRRSTCGKPLFDALPFSVHIPNECHRHIVHADRCS